MKKASLKNRMSYLIPEIKLVLVKERTVKTDPIRTPMHLEPYLEPLRLASEEYFVAFHLNVKNHVIGYHEVSHGTLSSSLVHPREVFKAALLSNAYGLIVAHNHPSDSRDPSREDLETTKQLVAAGRLLGVNVVDHLIVSSDALTSIRENHPLIWESMLGRD